MTTPIARPSEWARCKVQHLCATCARKLRKTATRIAKTGRLKGDLVHGWGRMTCGPVRFALNPAYRKQEG